MKRDTKRPKNQPQGWTDLSDLQDINKGQKCFVVGAGPSLAFLDISAIQDHVVISVNSSALLMPWTEDGEFVKQYWISNDSLCMKWDYFWTHVKKFKCCKIIRTSWKQYTHKLHGNFFRFFTPRKSDDLSQEDGGLCSISSIPTAIDLGILMGCSNIYLLGVDQKIIQSNSHFWQFWSEDKRPRRIDKGKKFRPDTKHQKEMFQDNIKVFRALHKYAHSKGTNIYNCSSRSALDVFPKLPFEEALK